MVVWSRRCFPISSPSSFPLAFALPHMFLLYPPPQTCAHATAEKGACVHERVCPWTEAASATHLPGEKWCDVIACYSHSAASQRWPLVHRPPLNLWQHQSRAAAYSDSRGCWYHHEEREPRWEDNTRGTTLRSARWTAALSDIGCLHQVLSKHLAFTYALIQIYGLCNWSWWKSAYIWSCTNTYVKDRSQIAAALQTGPTRPQLHHYMRL